MSGRMEVLEFLTPEGLPAWAALAVIFASFFTAALTAAFGLGGGLALLGVMSAVLPPLAVIPVHGVAQLGANASRFFLQRKDVVWPIVLWFAAGGLIGVGIGGRIAMELPVWALRGGVAAFILYTVWGPRPTSLTPGPRTFFATGAVGSFLTMFFGATGPIAATMLAATKLGRLNIVSTHAACMTAQHGLKSIAFGALGFAFAEWTFVIAGILLAGFAGSAAGTRFLRNMGERDFSRGFKFLLTAVAFYLLTVAAIDLITATSEQVE